MKLLMAKGAPEVLLNKCSHLLKLESGDEIPLDTTSRAKIQSKLDEWSMKSRRVIILCQMRLPHDDLPFSNGFSTWFKQTCNQLCFLGMLGCVDPPRPNLSQCIWSLRQYGARVVMATGDYSTTAVTIAKEVFF